MLTASNSPVPLDRLVRQRRCHLLTKCFLKSSSAFLKPFSLIPTDLALPTGFKIKPFSCRRFIVSKSNPFHALAPNPSSLLWVTKESNAQVYSSTFSSSYSIGIFLFHHLQANVALQRARLFAIRCKSMVMLIFLFHLFYLTFQRVA